MNNEYLIYTLSDPRNGEVRYVGCTANTDKRYYQHLYDSSLLNNARAEWLKELQKEQLGPVMLRIATCSAAERDATERHWIEHFLSLGASLTNTQHNPNISVTRSPGGGRKPLYADKTTKVAVTLLPSQVEAMKQLGNGNLSAGIRKAIEMNMHKARALQTAVFAIAEAEDGAPTSIRNSTIVVGKEGDKYWVTDNGEEVSGLTKEKAIEIIVENLIA